MKSNQEKEVSKKAMNRLNSVHDLETLRQDVVARHQKLKKWIRVCSGTACHSQGGEQVVQAFQQYPGGQGPHW